MKKPDLKMITAISVVHVAAYMAPVCPKLWTTFEQLPVDQRGKAIVFGASGTSTNSVLHTTIADPTIARSYSVHPVLPVIHVLGTNTGTDRGEN